MVHPLHNGGIECRNDSIPANDFLTETTISKHEASVFGLAKVFFMRFVQAGMVAAGCLLATTALAEILPRNAPAAGSVIARKIGEEVRFLDVSSWRGDDVQPDLLAGDFLRINANGSLAVLFADRTQMRLGRNTTLLVKQVGTSSDSAFTLESGTVWGRAER